MKLFKPLLTLAILFIIVSCTKESRVSSPVNQPPAVTANNAIIPFAATVTTENFETGTKAAYATGNVTLSTGVWTFNDALLGNLSTDRKNGTQSARVRNSGKLTMIFDHAAGASTVTVLHGKFGTDGNSTWQLWFSTDGGSTYTEAGTTVTTSTTSL